MNNITKYCTIDEICEHYPLKKKTLQFMCSQNKYFKQKCVKKLGRKVLINLQELENYIKEEGSINE